MTLTATGLLADGIGVILVAITIRGFVTEGHRSLGDVSPLGVQLSKMGLGKSVALVEKWGPRAGWLLIIYGLVLQFLDELLRNSL